MKEQKSSLIGSSPSPKVAVAIMDAWNARHQVGDKITYIDDDANPVRTTITGQCEIVAGCRCAKVAVNRTCFVPCRRANDVLLLSRTMKCGFFRG
jgi:hypothetical protein